MKKNLEEEKIKINLSSIDKKNEIIVDNIFNFVKSIIDNTYTTISDIRIKKRVTIKNTSYYFILHIIPQKNNKKIYLSIGAAYLAEKIICIKVRFNVKKFSDKKYYSLVLADLKDTIRHEIQHIIQIQSNKYDMKTLLQATSHNLDYFLLPHEIEAYVYGFVYFNKHIYKNKKDPCLDDILSNYCKRISTALTIEEKKLLYNIYYAYIAKNFKKFIYS